jgi:hypothetical protein
VSDIIEEIKEKSKDVKDKVIDNTKDVVDATKESYNAPSESSYINPNPTFISSSVTYVPNLEKNNSDIEIEKVDLPLTEHRVSEQKKIFSTNMQENESIKIINTTSFDAKVSKNQQIDKQQYNYKENYEFFFNPFIAGLKLWQIHYTLWMNFYSEVLKKMKE